MLDIVRRGEVRAAGRTNEEEVRLIEATMKRTKQAERAVEVAQSPSRRPAE
jgi:hypothetical protein